MTTLTDLIERLEKSEGGNTALDLEIDILMGRKKPDYTLDDKYAEYAAISPSYTTSLDAALTLVPEKYCPGVSQFCEHLDYHAWLAEQVRDEMDNRHTHMAFEGHSDASFAIALCIAALKARASEEKAKG